MREYLVIIRNNYCQFCTKTYVVTLLSEPSRCDGSDEGSQHMVSMRNKKSNPQILLLSRAVIMKDTEEILTSLCK